jgi:hypothetical protein
MSQQAIKSGVSLAGNRSPVATVEHRSSPRYSFTAAAVAMDPKSGARLNAHTMDLSPAGCYIDTMSSFPVGTELHLRLVREGKSFESEAQVVTSQPGVGMALTFTAAKPNQLPTLEKWLAELSGQSLAQEYTLQLDEAALSDHALKEQQHSVLIELLIALKRKGVLTEEEAEAMLSKLPR